MVHGTFLKFHHRIDVYKKTTVVNAAGQRAVTFSIDSEIPVFAQWTSSDIINQPYIANFEQLEIFIPKNYVSLISFNNRFKDLKDRYGNIIDESYYEIIGIEKRMQFNGKVHHSIATLKRIVEDAV
jgi:hypothetical protein